MKPSFNILHQEHCRTFAVSKDYRLSEATKMAKKTAKRNSARYGGRYTKEDIYDDENQMLFHDEYWYFEIITI